MSYKAFLNPIVHFYDSFWSSPLKILILLTYLIVAFTTLNFLGYNYFQNLYADRLKEEQLNVSKLKLLKTLQPEPILKDYFEFKQLSFNEKFLPDTENQVYRLIKYGQSALLQNDIDYAHTLFIEALSINYSNTAIYYNGIISFKRGQYNNAITFWEKLFHSAKGQHSDILKLYILLAAYNANNSRKIKQYLQP